MAVITSRPERLWRTGGCVGFGVTQQNEASLPRVTPSFGEVFGGAEDEEEGEAGVVGMELSLICHLCEGDRKGFV